MKILFSFVVAFLFLCCPIPVQSEDVEQIPLEEIVKAPSEEVLNYLLSEDMYQGTLSWQGNKTLTKFNYDKPKENR